MSTQPTPSDQGVTLAELLVAMIVTVVFFSVALAVGSRVFFAADNQQARAADLSANRRVVQLLDRQVRYANAVMSRSRRAAASTRRGSPARVNVAGVPTALQTCYQWKLTAGGALRYRSWKLPYAGTVPAWSKAAGGIRQVGTTPVFSTAVAPGDASVQARQQLAVSFASTSGPKAVATPIAVTFTAANTRSATPPSVPVCTEVPLS